MNRVAGLLLAGLVLLLLSVALTPSPPAQAQAVCPASGEPSTACDSASNCFRHCCLTTGLCPTSSCVTSLDAANNKGTLCTGRCLDEVSCNPFNFYWVPDDATEFCIGTISCKTANCDGRLAGSACIYTGAAGNFRICQ